MPPNPPTLSYFTRLSPSVYYLPRPPPTTLPPLPPLPSPASTPALATPATPAPRLVVLATWMGAQPAHMDKYIEPYRRLFPSSPILVLRSEPGDWLVPWKKPDMSPGADVVRSLFPEIAAGSQPNPSPSTPSLHESQTTASLHESKSRPELVIQVWSNGGSASLARLRQSLGPSILPPFTLVLDSTPSQFSYSGTYTAFSLVAPRKWRWILRPFLHGLVAWFWLLTFLRSALDFRSRSKSRKYGPLALLAASHNTRELQLVEARRTYIYSKEDALIPYKDVEEHAEDAEKKGFKVRMEEFVGTAHVAHARKEGERYWEVVRETWEGVPFAGAREGEGEGKQEA